MATMIEFDHVHKEFNGAAVIPDLSLTIPEREITVLVGRSGCGKTTTLKMINALIKADSGTIKYNDRPVTDYDLQELRWQIGYVLQQIALFPNMTVAQNIAVIPEMRRESAADIERRTRELLRSCSLDPDTYMNRAVDELSGGEAQRVGIMRALAADPPTILMDEPFSALDPLSRRQLQDLVLDLQTKLHKTVVFVTHDMNEALKMGDHIAVMDAGQIVQVGTPSEIRNNPADEVVAKLFAGTKQDDPFARSLDEIVADGYGALQSSGDAADLVPASTKLAAVITELTSGQTVRVARAGQKYALTAGDVLRYLTTQRN